MVDKRRGAPAKSRSDKPRSATQKSLLDLFPRKNIHLPAEGVEEDGGSAEPLAYVDHGAATPTDSVFISATSQSPVSREPELTNLKPKRLHPFFSKTLARPKTPTPDVIVIEILDGSNPVKSFTALDQIDSSERIYSDGGSQHDPIILDDSSPARPALSHDPGAPKPLASLSFPSLPKLPVRLHPRLPKTKYADALYPDKDSQHVRGPQRTFSASQIPYSRRTKYHPVATEQHSHIPLLLNQENTPDSSFLEFLPFSAESDRSAYLETIPDEHRRSHPAISRFTRSLGSFDSSCNMLWTDKWHPTRAEEVLGNESNAIYLRNWLRALELQFETNSPLTREKDTIQIKGRGKAKGDGRGIKRPRVVRAVTKRRGRKKQRIDSDDDDDWIVYSDEPEEEMLSLGEGEDDLEKELPRPRLSHTDSDEPLAWLSQSKLRSGPSLDSLTNTILLAGPPGVGKTAAVYACAEELGWEVFEVYPGIGKRNGVNIEGLVGDVGKNHIVGGTKPRGRDATAALHDGHDAFSRLRAKGEEGDRFEVDMEDDRPPPVDFGFAPRSDAQSRRQANDKPLAVRQSVILLDEVDILFKEDANFWTAVTNFIKDCKRPVICTCNDLSLIPTLDLPLQTTLKFEACPPLVAASYLQGLCSAEGCLVERNSLLRLYASTYELDSIDLPDIPAPHMSSDFPEADLRRTIHCLQFQCSTTGKVQLNVDSAGKSNLLAVEMRPPTRELAVDHADLISYADSYLMRRPLDAPEALALALSRYEGSADDEVGHPILRMTERGNGDFGFGFGDRDGEIARGLSRGEPTWTIDGYGLFRARVDHQIQVAAALGGNVWGPVLAMRRSVVCLEYEPWIRQMVAADEEQELADRQRTRIGRNTRNSGGGYMRGIRLGESGRAGLRGTELGY